MKNMNIGEKILFGSLSGIGIASLIALGYSLAYGKYSPVAPGLLKSLGSLNSAVALQTIFAAVIGVVFSLASNIWNKNDWTLLKKSLAHYLITIIPMSIFAYILSWMQKSILGFLAFLLSYTLIFLVIWVLLYIKVKRDIQKMNAKLR